MSTLATSTQLRHRFGQWVQILAAASALTACADTNSNFDQQNQKRLSYEIIYPAPVDKVVSDHPQYLALHNNFRQWLMANTIAPDRLEILLSDSSQTIMQVVDLENGAIAEMQLPDWYKPGGTIPTNAPAFGQGPQQNSDANFIPVDFKQPSIHSALYLGSLYFKKRCYTTNRRLDMQEPTSEERRHLHRFLLNETIWTQHDYDLAEAALSQLENTPAQPHCHSHKG